MQWLLFRYYHGQSKHPVKMLSEPRVRMINPADGVLTFQEPSVRIGPGLKLREFLDADWAQGRDLVVNGPWHSRKLDGEYRSGSLTFFVVLYFQSERLARIDFCASDPKFGTSWADYTEEKERQRQRSHDAWLSECLGDGRSFWWGAVWSGIDQKAGGSSIVISYNSAGV